MSDSRVTSIAPRLAASIFLVFVGWICAQETVVTVEGFSSPRDGLAATGRLLAIEDALRTAVQQQVGIHLESETLVENYVLITDRIFTQAEGFARVLDVVEEGFRADGTYRVLSRVAVSEAAVTKDLKDVIQANGDPRVLVIVDVNPPHLAPAVVNLLRRPLIHSGLSVVSKDGLLKAKEVSAETLRVGADVAVTATIKATEDPNPPPVAARAGLVFANIASSIAVIDLGTDYLIYSSSGSTSGFGTGFEVAARTALEKSLPREGDSIATELTAWLQGGGVTSRHFVLIASNVDSYEAINRLVASIEKQFGSAVLRRFTNRTAELEVTYSGRLEVLLAHLSNLNWNISEVEGTKITIEIKNGEQ